MSTEQKELVLISGASSGIGLAIAEALIEAGFEVIGLARDFSKTQFEHAQFHKEQMDLSASEIIQNKLPVLLKSYKRPLRALINNAGIGRMGYLEQLSVPDIQQVLATPHQSYPGHETVPASYETTRHIG